MSFVKLCCRFQFTVLFMIRLLSIVQAKEKKTKGGLMSRFTSMKKSKSPPPATYSMDNPVFDDGSAAASPQHPVHVR
jgi:E3 ubiquitin-protein ligase SH3RF